MLTLIKLLFLIISLVVLGWVHDTVVWVALASIRLFSICSLIILRTRILFLQSLWCHLWLRRLKLVIVCQNPTRPQLRATAFDVLVSQLLSRLRTDEWELLKIEGILFFVRCNTRGNSAVLISRWSLPRASSPRQL
jgi:hypothetical protein